MKSDTQIWETVEQHYSRLSELSEKERKNYLLQLHDTDPQLHRILNDLFREEEDLHPIFSRSADDILGTWHDNELTG
ncbi:MAG: hypothetical protein KFF73_03725, partial [Cyclobacteriaceae bacterium]|nr:hypothetical protein [Cyclobacteriaceae bacterium]